MARSYRGSVGYAFENLGRKLFILKMDIIFECPRMMKLCGFRDIQYFMDEVRQPSFIRERPDK